MRKVNALELRQSLSKIIRRLERNGEPILLEKGRRPAAVIISLEDYKKRFAEKEADERRKALRDRILGLARRPDDRRRAEDIVRELRNERER